MAIDDEGNRGEISNLVAVYIHEETTTSTTTTTTKKPSGLLTMQTASRRLGVVGDDEDEVLTGGPSVFRIITGKKTLSTVIPYVKKQEATDFRPLVFLPTVRGAAGGTRASKRTKPPRLISKRDVVMITLRMGLLSISHNIFLCSPSLKPATLPPSSRTPSLMLTPTGPGSPNRSRITPIGAHLGLKINPSQGRLSIRDLFESELLANGNTQVLSCLLRYANYALSSNLDF